MKKVKQYRYYSDSNDVGINGKDSNQPPAVRKDYVTGEVFQENFPITQIGIQALPGTKFYLNHGDPIIIGITGIYELTLNGQIEITSLSFNNDSMKMIEEARNACLIVDTIYEDGEEG